ncbi:MAG: terminase large subunit [Pirellulales bacterium]
MRDLVDGPKRGLKFDPTKRDHALNFFSFLKLPEGDKPFLLAGWQKFVIGSIFGWLGPDGYRRFRTLYAETGKGSGKTPTVAGIGLYGVTADDEPAAEVYTGGVTRDQANYLLNDAVNLVNAAPALRKMIDANAHNLFCSRTGGFMRPVSSEGRTLDQKRVHMALLDEIHEHSERIVVQKMRAGVKGRNQPLIAEITNSGHNRNTICWEHHEYSEKVLLGITPDDSWFAYICTLDPCAACAAEGKTQPTDGCPRCDDWRDEKTWIKANPSLDEVGIPGRKYLREQVTLAEGIPTEANTVMRLNFCIWTETAQKCIPMDKWDLAVRDFTAASLAGRLCYAGFDIGATSDFTAFVLVFPHDDIEYVEIPVDLADPDGPKIQFPRRSFSVLPYFWLPERPVKRDARTEEIIAVWKRQGLIRVTAGDTVDYDQVLADIQQIVAPFNLELLAFDRGFQGVSIGTNLTKVYGDRVKVFIQGIISMAPPFRELLELLKAGRLHHDGNPVLRWMASNTAAETRGGLSKPCKEKSSEKIDGITALTMGLGAAIQAPPPEASIYESEGNLSL